VGRRAHPQLERASLRGVVHVGHVVHGCRGRCAGGGLERVVVDNRALNPQGPRPSRSPSRSDASSPRRAPESAARRTSSKACSAPSIERSRAGDPGWPARPAAALFASLSAVGKIWCTSGKERCRRGRGRGEPASPPEGWTQWPRRPPKGERDPAVLAQMEKVRMRAKIAQLEEALSGHFGHHHAVACRQIIDHIDFLDRRSPPSPRR
jgi:hypothetical protein